MSFWDVFDYINPMNVAAKIGSWLGIDMPHVGAGGADSGAIGDYLDAFTGKSGIDAQYAAIEANKQMNSDTNAQNLQAARETNEMNYRIWREAQTAQRAYFDETNAYNSAAAQKQRLLDAGLNPALAMYHGVNAGSAQASTVPSQPQMVTPQLQAYYQQPVDYSPMTSSIANILGIAQAFGSAQSMLAKGTTDQANIGSNIALSTATANLVAEQYKGAVYDTVNKMGLAKVNADPKVIDARVSQAVKEAYIKSVMALYTEDKEKLGLKEIESVIRNNFASALFTEENREILKSTRGTWKKLEENFKNGSKWTEFSGDNPFYLMAKLFLMGKGFK